MRLSSDDEPPVVEAGQVGARMGWEWMASVVVFAIAMSATPGPNNTMLTASGANWGFLRSLPHMAGISLGVTVILAAVGAFGSPLVAAPGVHDVLKWAGICYLLWLAWKIATARPVPEGTPAGRGGRGRPLNSLEAAAFQLVNPKFWVIAASAMVTYVGEGEGAGSALLPAITLALVFGIVTFPCSVLWTLVGVGAGRLLRTARALRTFNIVMAALLVASLIPIVLD
ncbi:LysE family translocator [Tistrella mobilis]|uniref:LysE family translocator n=1 Tax=Tistrella mobilis TaxID=171437 RepID=UPI0035582BFC